MTHEITAERMTELLAKRDAGTLTNEEYFELFNERIEDVIARNKQYEVEAQIRSRRELSKPRAVVNVLDQILAMEQGGGHRASEDKDWAVANTLEAAVQGLIAFAQENAPGWTIRKVVSTLALQITCTIQPGSQYNGIDYEEHWTGYDEDNGVRRELPDHGAGMIIDHLGNVLHKPEDYDMGHVLKPIGEHDFSYELPILPRGIELSPELGQQSKDLLKFVMRELIQSEISDPNWAQDLQVEPAIYFEDLFAQTYDGPYLREIAQEILDELLPEPDADYENPAGR